MFDWLHDEGVGGNGGRRATERSLQAFRDRVRPPATSGMAADGPSARPVVTAGMARHCWVTDPPTAQGRWPGIVVEWRRREGRWQGRVVVVIGDGPDSHVIHAWLDQDHLAPTR